MLDTLLTIREAAHLTGVSDITMRRWITKDLLTKSPEVVSVIRQSNHPNSPFVYQVSQALVEKTFADEIKRRAMQKTTQKNDKAVDKPFYKPVDEAPQNRELVSVLKADLLKQEKEISWLRGKLDEKDEMIARVIQMGFRLNAPSRMASEAPRGEESSPAGDTINQEPTTENESDNQDNNQEPQAETKRGEE